MRIVLEPILLIVPFLLTGVWVVLYRSRSVRVDIYHHDTQSALPEPPQPHPEGTRALSVRPARYIVVNVPVKRIEVKQ